MCCVSFKVVGSTDCPILSLTLQGISQHATKILKLLKYHILVGPLVYLRFILHHTYNT